MIGIEIEGYYRDLPAAQRLAESVTGERGTSDGSLASRATCRGEDADGGEESCDCDDEDCSSCHPTCPGRATCRVCGTEAWEFRTHPGTLGEQLRQLHSLYPDAVSYSCGMHVHASFLDPSDVTMLAGDPFLDTFYRGMRAWGERAEIARGTAFWKRLENENRYCRPHRAADLWGDDVARANDTRDRYAAVNFQAYHEQRKTVEFRLLPMFQMEQVARSAIAAIVDIVESYLAAQERDHARATIVVPDLTTTAVTESHAREIDDRPIFDFLGSREHGPIVREIPCAIDPSARARLIGSDLAPEVDLPAVPVAGVGERIVPSCRVPAVLQQLAIDHQSTLNRTWRF